MENKFLVLHKRIDKSEILIRVCYVHSVCVFEGATIVDMGGDESNYFAVLESYDEVKEMLING